MLILQELSLSDNFGLKNGLSIVVGQCFPSRLKEISDEQINRTKTVSASALITQENFILRTETAS